ncbi:MAG: hypothetical protein KDF54_12640 [Hydrogenophaga sp.]|nr:hypothetical protein [Hydrogenophaga sp.]
MTRQPGLALAFCLSALLAACGGGSAQDNALDLSMKGDRAVQTASASPETAQGSQPTEFESEFWAKSALLVQNEIHAQATSASAPSSISPKVSSANAAALYRFYNIDTGAHLFTRDVTERDTILNTLSQYRYEGPVFSAWSASEASLSPVYRFYNATTGTHFFTISEAEKNSVQATRPDMSLDGVAYYASPTAQSGTTALYRFLHLQKGFHFYTASATERDAIIANLPGTYRYEGPAFHVNSSIGTYSKALAPLAGKVNSYGNINALGGAARLGNIVGMTLDSSGNLFVVDREGDGDWYDDAQIRKISPSGQVTSYAGSWDTSLSFANGVGSGIAFEGLSSLVFDSTGNLLFGDTRTVRKINASLTSSTVAGSLAESGLVNGQVQAARFRGVSGIALDSSGNIFVSECFTAATYANSSIRKITPVGIVSTFAGADYIGYQGTGFVDAQGTTARFRCARQITIDSQDNVYVADSTNNSIRKITPAGLVTTFAGQSSRGIVDGNGTGAKFDYPYAIAIDKSTGNLYTADRDGYTVRKITPDGTVTTVVGVAYTKGVFFGALPAGLANIRGLAVGNGRLYIASSNSISWTNLP